MDKILELALKKADAAEVYQVISEETPVSFQANKLKSIQSKQSSSVSLRIIKDGRLGYASASGQADAQKLVDNAVETAQFGMEASFEFPKSAGFPEIAVHDKETEDIPISEMIELGNQLIDPLIKDTPELLCDGGVSRNSYTLQIMNSAGVKAEYKKTIFGLGVGGTLVRDTDMLFVGDGQDSCRPIRDVKEIVDAVIKQLEYARNTVPIATKPMTVIFTPDGVSSAFVPSLMSAFNGKTVLQGASPIGDKTGQTVFDKRLSLYDDPLIEYAPHSRPCDDEGVPSQKTALIENGVVRNFLYDLQTAGLAKKISTGSGSRGRGGLMTPSPSAFVFNTGDVTFEEMIADIKEGLVVEQLMGAEQGNILGGDFSGNVLLGYKVENGKLTGRVKNTMVSGNVYKILKDVTSFGKTGRWVGGGLFTPHICCHDISVASKA